ncbi:hypothetical protein HQ934_09200 [Enterococcus faecium]|nr:hypothetical protein [Enterococcus faecium]MCI1180815.1 hypothetical protein [Enterococcus faecium]MCT9086464.1 hypothetical protein [Enterococcus faecium]NTR33031.1 hypothetical protein [Enterococcus faecium]RBS56531.1 hypothetical protein EB33_01718 [Enterococcus faecium]
MFENMTRDQAIDHMLEQFAIHSDGDDQQAHVIATERNAGFASPETVALATGHLLKDNYLNEKYDFWDIPFGSYATVYGWADNGIPLPDTMVPGDLINLYVSGEDNRRKVYVMVVQKNGSIWYLNTSQNTGQGGGNSNSTVWKYIPQTTILWTQDSSPASVGQNMNLAASTRRFRRLRFTINGIGTRFVIETPAVDNPVIVFSAVAGSINESYQVRINLEMVRDNIVLKFSKCRLVTHKTTGTTFSDDTGFTIAGIEGIY